MHPRPAACIQRESRHHGQEMDLIRKHSEDDYAVALESWTFVDLIGKRPLLTSCFGDVFFVTGDGIWLLDTVAGQLKFVCGSEDELQEILNSRGGQEDYLMADLVVAAHEAGIAPQGRQIYDFRVPPVLGGANEASNLQVAEFPVAINILGQIHSQVRDLPPSSSVAGVTIT